MSDEIGHRLLHVHDLGSAAVPAQHALVRDLSAALRIEDRPVEDDVAALAGLEQRGLAPVAHDREHARAPELDEVLFRVSPKDRVRALQLQTL